MSFSVMLEILKKKENKKIVFVQCGHFYLATEGDAVTKLLEKENCHNYKFNEGKYNEKE